MKKRHVIIINAIILILIMILFIIFGIKYYAQPEETNIEECVDVNNVASFVHDTCYDAYTKTIFMQLKRSYDIYNIKSLSLSFFDFSNQTYKITEVPNINQTKAYKIPSEKNPETLNFRLDIVKDFSASICSEPRILFVTYCPPGISQEEVEVGIEEGGAEEYIEIGEEIARADSDSLDINLVEKERIWESKCQSSWSCSEWEECIDGVQKRTCIDSKNCFIPTDLPDMTRFCGGKCVERWECQWSDCSGGFTKPECADLNKCGTTYNLPQPLECKSSNRCTPDITCSEWSECKADYNFIDLIGNINEITGTKSRTCIDSSGCTQATYETKNCSLSVDIYTRKIIKCGKEYIGVYNRLTNDLIVKIEQSKTKDNPYLNIQITDRDDQYCDYCFDGIKNGDETGIDCGGSCKSCSEKQTISNYKKPTIWSRIGNWIESRLI